MAPFVAEPKIERKVARPIGAAHDIGEAGLEAGAIILEKKVFQRVEEVGWVLMLNNNEDVVEIIRFRLAEGGPITLRQTILPMKPFPELAPTDLEGVLPLSQFLEEEYDGEISDAEQKIQPVSADSRQSKILKIRGSALLYLEKIFHSNVHVPQRNI